MKSITRGFRRFKKIGEGTGFRFRRWARGWRGVALVAKPGSNEFGRSNFEVAL
jgi:hypothetical protein